MQELQIYRDQINNIDSQIIELLAKRFEVVKNVGIYKKANNINPFQPNRWQEVLKSRKQKAQKLGINQDFIENIWNEIHKYSLELEK
ncbi:MAG: chorismate mutase [Candidatus Gracilibacteria bacterium]|nr:chorismate mutase [Candidatus Gracilibacteria bacterium]